MVGSLDSKLTCEKCGEQVEDDDASCPSCGVLFTDLLVCSQHPAQLASGVCVVCREPYCDECGEIVNHRFVCGRHALYDIEEGMGRVMSYRATSDPQLPSSCLEQAGLHPYTIPGRGIYVPLSEVLEAEKVLKEVGYATN
jgi:hypothetical protein